MPAVASGASAANQVAAIEVPAPGGRALQGGMRVHLFLRYHSSALRSALRLVSDAFSGPTAGSKPKSEPAIAASAFTAAVTPPLVVALLLGVFWRRYTPAAARWTMLGGSAVIFVSIVFPEIITPLAHGVPMREVGDEFLAGKNQYKFMRALFGIAACLVIGVTVTLWTRPRALDEIRGLVWGTISDAIANYKGRAGDESESPWAAAQARLAEVDPVAASNGLPVAQIGTDVANALGGLQPGDLVYISDPRRWLGGLRSCHAVVGDEAVAPSEITIGQTPWTVITRGAPGPVSVRVKRLY